MAKKPLAALIVAKMGKKPEDEAPMGDPMSDEVESAEDEGMNVAAEEVLAAIKSDDVEGLKIALKSFFEQC